MKNVLLLLVFLFHQACRPTPDASVKNTQVKYSEPEEQEQNPRDTASKVKIPMEAFRLDSSSLERFEYNWYCFAFQDTYRQFQKDAVTFPFDCFLKDSSGNKYQVRFMTLEKMVAWRQEFPDIFSNAIGRHGPKDRVVFEGYPQCTFGTEPTAHPQRMPRTESMLVTYIAPFQKSDYYFRRERGRWKVFKSAHWQYTGGQLEKMPQKRFEDFLLRFVSDVSFRLEHTQFPIKYLRQSAEGDTEVLTPLSKKEEEKRAKSAIEDHSWSMTIYPDHSGSRDEPDAMYVNLLSEGGGCFRETFRRIKGQWILTEMLNCSN